MAPRKRKSVTTALTDIDAQIAKLKEDKKELLRKRAEEVAKLVQDSGLALLEIDDETLLAALKETAARFQSGAAA